MTDTQKESFRHKICAIRSQILFPILLCLMNPINVNGELLEWSRPDIDQWMYPAASTPGMRMLGPTFASLGGLGGSIDPARRGATGCAAATAPGPALPAACAAPPTPPTTARRGRRAPRTP